MVPPPKLQIVYPQIEQKGIGNMEQKPPQRTQRKKEEAEEAKEANGE